jgi:hypothetical protein
MQNDPQKQKPKTVVNKSFASTWTGKGPVHFYNRITGNVRTEEQSIVLTITKYTDKIYFGTFTEISPIPGNSYNFVATQTTENPNIIVSATTGINSFYFSEKDGFNVLNTSWNSSVADTRFGKDVIITANIKFKRNCNC